MFIKTRNNTNLQNVSMMSSETWHIVHMVMFASFSPDKILFTRSIAPFDYINSHLFCGSIFP